MPKSEILDIMKTSGPAATGLTFIWMPQLFEKMIFGKTLSILFFLGLSFAGFSSLISMLELAVKNLIDFGLKRKQAVIWIVIVCFVMGIPSAMNINILANQDFVWGVALMISGIFFALAASKYGIEKILKEYNNSQFDWQFPKLWTPIINYLVPLLGLVLIVWWMSLSATNYAPDDWYNPFSPFSVATCVVQWSVVLAFFSYFNTWITGRIYNPLNNN